MRRCWSGGMLGLGLGAHKWHGSRRDMLEKYCEQYDPALKLTQAHHEGLPCPHHCPPCIKVEELLGFWTWKHQHTCFVAHLTVISNIFFWLNSLLNLSNTRKFTRRVMMVVRGRVKKRVKMRRVWCCWHEYFCPVCTWPVIQRKSGPSARHRNDRNTVICHSYFLTPFLFSLNYHNHLSVSIPSS